MSRGLGDVYKRQVLIILNTYNRVGIAENVMNGMILMVMKFVLPIGCLYPILRNSINRAFMGRLMIKKI